MKKIIIFSLPVLLILLLPTFTIIFSKEYYSVKKVVQLQKVDERILFNLCCSNVRREYKEALLELRQPEIISLGTSRVLQFRKEMFRDPTTFTNLGQVIIGPKDINHFGQMYLASSTIKVVILGLDFQMFNPEFISPDISTVLPDNSLERFASIVATNWRRIYSFYFEGKTSVGDLYKKSSTSKNIGLISITTSTGFRGDGSYDYGSAIHGINYQKSLNEQIKISASSARSSGQHGKTISEQSLQEIEDFLEFCKSHSIEVVGLMSPLPRATYNELVSIDDGYKRSVISLPLVLSELFNKSGFEFYNLSNAQKTLGANDSEFVDPLHGGDKMYLRTAIYLAQYSKTLAKYFDIVNLYTWLSESKTPYLNP